MDKQHKPMDRDAVRSRLAEGDGTKFWRSLGELSESDEFLSFLEDEFPQQARPLKMEMDRRQFMMLSSASLALAGLAGCRALPQDKLVPYVKAPEELVPGIPVEYASAYSHGGYARGVLVTSNDGRPTKIEGNPGHPASLGKSDVFMQASVLNLYDPDRAKNVAHVGETSTWEAFISAARPTVQKQKENGGAGLRILTETLTSPTLIDQIQAILKAYPQAQWHQYEPVNNDAATQGAILAFGRPVNTIYNFAKADRILALDSDFFMDLPGSVRYAQDYSQGKRVDKEKTELNRLYAVESTPTLVGAKADHRLPLRASEIETFTRALAAKFGVTGFADTALPAGASEKFLNAVAEDLQSAKGRGIVVPGARQTPAVHALCHAINAALGNVGTTVVYTDPIEVQPAGQPNTQAESLTNLVRDMQAGKVETLLILGGNPVYDAPINLLGNPPVTSGPDDGDFSRQLSKVALSVHLSLYDNETSARCQWLVPDTHYLEAWGDLRAYDGTASIVQPLIAPLYESRSALELLSTLTDQPALPAIDNSTDPNDDPHSGYRIVREYWRRTLGAANFESVWGRALNEGVIGTGLPAKTFPPIANLAALLPASKPTGEGMEIIFAPDPTIWDGRYSNNGWLQELPKTLTKVTWDNVVQMNPAMMERLHLEQEDLVQLEYKGRKVIGPVWPSFGHPDNAVTITLGYGRTRMGQLAVDRGFNANAIRTTEAPWFDTGLKITPAGGKYSIATTENHHILEEKNAKGQQEIHSEGQLYGQPRREIIGVQSIEEYKKSKKLFGEGSAAGANQEELDKAPTLYPDTVGGKEELPEPLVSDYSFDYKEFNAWAMSIDMNTCIGCNACTIACQAENNIPTVGKDQVMRGREMHWIRIDRYYRGTTENPETYFQPLACQHCEKAPCEPVCPVAATVHSHDGLNQMVYNRCIGTKYCSNNCPYKVRRFNFLNYANHFETPVLKLAKNPDVTVRSRGVMEKCTYCVQRISKWRIDQKKKYDARTNPDALKYKDKESFQVACQQACPTNAIVFGDKNNPENAVTQAREQSQNYWLLEELNTRPRTSYLAHIRNPNPALPSQDTESKEG